MLHKQESTNTIGKRSQQKEKRGKIYEYPHSQSPFNDLSK